MQTIDLFPKDYTVDNFFTKSYKPLAPISKLFQGCKEEYEKLSRGSKIVLKEKFDVYISTQMVKLKTEVRKKNLSKTKITDLLFNMKNALETMPYTISTKQVAYVHLKKELLPIIRDVLDEEQLIIVYTLFCITTEEEVSRRRKKEAKKNLDRIIPINITDEFIEKVYKPTAIDLITNNRLTDMVIGVMMITGRRPSEVVQTMELDFSTYNETGRVAFSGQKKKSIYFKDSKYDRLDIPLLMDKAYFLLFKERFETLKSVVKFSIAKGKTLPELDAREFGNWAGCLRNAYTKRLPQLTSVMSKTMYRIRAVYACYMLENDNEKNMSPSAYICSILGHGEDDRVNLNYEKICYSRSGKTAPVKETTKEKAKYLNEVKDSIKAFVSKSRFKFAPSNVLTCETSSNKKKTIKGYSFYLCFGRTESEAIVSIYYPLKCKARDKIKVLAITEKAIDKIDWVADKSGLCELVLKKYVPEFKFKKTKKEKKLDRISASFDVKKDKKSKKEN